jgi:hypothetical protein
MVGVAVMIGSAETGAQAQLLSEDDMPDTKFVRGVLKALGLRRDEEGIEYRERSPLVVPPARELPPPEKTTVPQKTADWPNDPDVQRAKELAAERNKPRKSVEEEAQPLRPSELERPGRVARRIGIGGGPERTAESSALPMSPYELGSKSIFSSFLGPKDEYATFTGEPPRSSLTEPPAGYRTPSSAQPYGVGQQKWDYSSPERHIPIR